METEKIQKIEVIVKPSDAVYFAIAKELKEEDPDNIAPDFITTNASYVIEVDLAKPDENR